MAYNDRNLAALAARSTGETFGLSHFMVHTPAQRDAVFKLRYDAYFGQGLIRESDVPSLSDWQDAESSSSIYGITLNGDLVSTIRLSVISRHEKACATYSMFKDNLDPIIATGKRILDGSRLAVNCSSNATRRSVVLYTLSLATSVAEDVGADFGTIIARHSHVPFYQRYGFGLLCGPFSYHEALTPLSLMMIGLPKAASHLSADDPGFIRSARAVTPAPMHA